MQNVDHYGVRAVLGRDELMAAEILVYNELRYMASAWRSRDAYRDKDGAPNWAEWAGHAPEAAQYLARLEIEQNG